MSKIPSGKLAALFLAFSMAGEVHGADFKQGQWESVVKAAKAEGQLVLLNSEHYGILFAEFEKKFPEIKVIAGAGGA
jgi:hypothetical protein